MRKLVSLTLILAAFLFTGCYEMTEEYTVNANNTGQYEVKMDMGKLFAFVESMGGAESMKNDPEFAKLKDTTIYFKTYTDTASDLTADQKEWFRNASMRMNMKVEEKLFKMEMKFPFKSLEQLEKNLQTNGGGYGTMIDKVMNSKKADDEEETDEEKEMKKSSDDMMAKMQNLFKTGFKNGNITRIVDTTKFAAMKDDPAMAQIAQVVGMMGEMEFTTILHLPRPVKKATGNGIQVSADKKTATIKYSMSKIMEDPSAAAFTLEY